MFPPNASPFPCAECETGAPLPPPADRTGQELLCWEQMDGGMRLPWLISLHLTFPLIAATLLASFGSSLLYGYNLAVVNSPAVHIKAFYNATWSRRYGHSLGQELLTTLYSLTVSVFAVGGLLGALPVGILVTRYGSSLLVFLASLLMGFSRYLQSPEMVIIGRFVTGICLSVVPMYLGEIAPKNLRGLLGLVPSIFICLGVFSAQVLGLPELLGEVGAVDGSYGMPPSCCCFLRAPHHWANAHQDTGAGLGYFSSPLPTPHVCTVFFKARGRWLLSLCHRLSFILSH
uniref:Major facilitator superfamily (MFS) profile domain-containing protein n=1 Tax=Pelusios castaneus TaxID=367368 RepID=A0A8C8R905_9SAUR